MSVGFVIVVAACAFCAGLAAMIYAEGKTSGFAEDATVGGWLWLIFTLATVGMMTMGWWVR